MDTIVSNTMKNRSAWFWLILFVSVAAGVEITAVQTRDTGLAISGIGFALMGAYSFLAPIPLTGSLREVFQSPTNADSRLAALGAVGSLLCLIGVAMR